VAGRPDPEWGERVVAWVVPAHRAPTLEELRDLVKEQLAPFAAPRELVLVDALAKTAIGKVRRDALAPAASPPAARPTPAGARPDRPV